MLWNAALGWRREGLALRRGEVWWGCDISDQPLNWVDSRRSHANESAPKKVAEACKEQLVGVDEGQNTNGLAMSHQLASHASSGTRWLGPLTDAHAGPMLFEEEQGVYQAGSGTMAEW
jgi:hypothetical protein